MDISQLDLTSPGPVLDAITDDVVARATVAAFGRAKGFDRLSSSASLRNLWVSGVNTAVADLIGSLAALQRLVIHDLRVPDLSAFARLEQLEELTIAGSSKLRSLTGVERLRKLRLLVLFDNCNYQDIDRIAGLTNLETLCLEGGFSKHLSLATLQPVRQLIRLRRLRLASLKVADGSLEPLHPLQSLREVFIAKVFAPTEFRSLGDALPDARGEFVDSFRKAG